MERTSNSVHVVTTERRYKDKLYRSHLLRRSYRERGKVKKETVANLTALGDHVVGLIRDALRGRHVGRLDEAFEVTRSRRHGDIRAVRTAMKQLGFDQLVATRSSRERNLVVAMIAARIVDPQTKLATIRSWSNTTLPEVLDIEDANEDDLYEAMDWLLTRQSRIEKKLATRHLHEDGLALYDLSSSYFEGHACPLAALGHNRDRKKGKIQVNYGLLTDERGCPVAVSVFPGNTSDTKTLLPQITKMRDNFGIERFVIVGDRGMITQKQIDALCDVDGVDWITALRSEAIRKLVKAGAVQMGLFDERNLFEVTHPDFPGERLVACRNPDLARRRANKRQALLDATELELQKVRGMAGRGRVKGRDKIGVRVGKVINKYKVAKHFTITITDDSFLFECDRHSINAEAALDGIYVVRTSLHNDRIETDEIVRCYKRLTQVERAFRSLKTMDLHIRPIHHHLERRVRAHIFLCMLAYYVKWHMSEAWRQLLFSDDEQAAKATRDPVAAARRSDSALHKVSTKRTDQGAPAHSFQTLLAELGTVVRNTCRRPGANDDEASFHLDTAPTPTQQQAFDLLQSISL